jgi:iron(III) transport system ATP-binding protein
MRGAAMTSLIISDVYKSYGKTPVLHGVDLKVEPGTLMAILGTSGVGKTTLLRAIAGFETVDGGSIALGDMVVDDSRHRVPAQHRRIGYVPQDGALFPHLTVRGNVAFALPRKERKGPAADHVLDLVGLKDLQNRYPHQLSGGQQQRVALGRALASQPRLVLLDEPFSSLDASLRETVRAEVLGVLRATQTTAVLVTHDQDEALSSADRVAIMRDGRITQVDTPRDVYQRPVDPQTAAFLGTANLIEGTYDGGHVITAFGQHVLNPGQRTPAQGPVTVLIRPEQLQLSAIQPGTLAGRVADCSYYGHDALLTVCPQGVADLGELRARTDSPDPPEPGAMVGLAVHGCVAAWSAGAPSSNGHHDEPLRQQTQNHEPQPH